MKEMMREAFKFMMYFYLEIEADVTAIYKNSYPHKTMLMLSEQMKNPMVLDVMKYFGVQDHSFLISAKVIDFIMSVSKPDVTVDFVKKSRRNAQIPLVIYDYDIDIVRESSANERMNERLKAIDASLFCTLDKEKYNIKSKNSLISLGKQSTIPI